MDFSRRESFKGFLAPSFCLKSSGWSNLNLVVVFFIEQDFNATGSKPSGLFCSFFCEMSSRIFIFFWKPPQSFFSFDLLASFLLIEFFLDFSRLIFFPSFELIFAILLASLDFFDFSCLFCAFDLLCCWL